MPAETRDDSYALQPFTPRQLPSMLSSNRIRIMTRDLSKQWYDCRWNTVLLHVCQRKTSRVESYVVQSSGVQTQTESFWEPRSDFRYFTLDRPSKQESDNSLVPGVGHGRRRECPDQSLRRVS